MTLNRENIETIMGISMENIQAFRRFCTELEMDPNKAMEIFKPLMEKHCKMEKNMMAIHQELMQYRKLLAKANEGLANEET